MKDCVRIIRILSVMGVASIMVRLAINGKAG
jgi:hypothetical protein